jgi:hypothetical protein
VPSVQHSVKGFFAEILTLPSAALGKAFFAECPTKGTRQRIQHSAKPRIPVVFSICVFNLYMFKVMLVSEEVNLIVDLKEKSYVISKSS